MRDHFLPGTANFEKLFQDVITETSGQSGHCGQFLLVVDTSGVCLCRHGAQHCDIITRDSKYNTTLLPAPSWLHSYDIMRYYRVSGVRGAGGARGGLQPLRETLLMTWLGDW